MLNFIRNLFTGKRAYAAAGGGRRGSGIQSMRSPLSDANAARSTVAARARHVAVNNPLGSAAVSAWTAQAIGTGIKPTSLHTSPRVRAALSGAFTAWTDVSDDEGMTDWFGQQHNLLKSIIITGEGLALLITTPEGLRIRILDPEQLDSSYSVQPGDGVRIVQGVEFSAAGKRTHYHIFDQPSGQEFTLQRSRKRIPAEDVVHVFRQDWPGQVRGISWFAPSLIRISDLDGWRDAQLVRQRVSALLTGFITSPDGSGTPFEGEQNGTSLTGGLEPGALRFLEPGQEYTQSTPAAIGQDVISFASIAEREIAVGLGLPAHAFGDVGAANYSSLKSANTAWKARVESVQWSIFIHQVCLPVWRRWATVEVLAGRIKTSVAAAMPVKHTTPPWPSLEPVKDATAANMELAAGLTTRRDLLAQRGEDIEQVDQILADDNARAKKLGLVFNAANDNQPAAQAA